MNDKFKLNLGSFVAGFFNGLFGAGGGILIVPILENLNLNSKKAHATSVVIMAIFSLLSFIVYYFNGCFNFKIAIWFLPAGFVGAIFGVLVLKKIRIKWLKKIFGVLILIFSLRLLLK